MRWQRPFTAIGALVLSGGGALAEPATPEGAKAIEHGYAAYFGQAAVDEGIVSVEPQGEGYLVTWNLQKALDAVDAPKDAFQIDNFTYLVTPGANGTWTHKADHLPQIAFDVPTEKGQAKGVVAFDGFHLDTSYDPQATEFLHSTLGANDLTGVFHVVDSGQASDIKVREDAITIETRGKPSADGAGIDIALAQAIKSMGETVLAPPPDGSATPIEMSFNLGGGASGATIEGLRAKEIGEFWKYVVAEAAGGGGSPPALVALLKPMLPLWTEIRANAKMDDLQVQSPFGTARMKSLGESVDISGLTSSGFAAIGVQLEELSLSSALLPSWISSLSPLSMDLNLRLTGQDWDKAARVALDSPHFAESGDLPPEVNDQIKQVLLAGHPKISLTPGHLKIPALDLSFEGEADIDVDSPTAHFNVSADSLDKTMELLEDIAKVQPDAQNALVIVTFLKGLSTTGADGRLVWDIETNGSAVTVNGQALPTGP